MDFQRKKILFSFFFFQCFIHFGILFLFNPVHRSASQAVSLKKDGNSKWKCSEKLFVWSEVLDSLSSVSTSHQEHWENSQRQKKNVEEVELLEETKLWLNIVFLWWDDIWWYVVESDKPLASLLRMAVRFAGQYLWVPSRNQIFGPSKLWIKRMLPKWLSVIFMLYFGKCQHYNA